MFIEWVKEQLAAHGITQKDLGDAVGMSKDQIGRLLKGERQLKSAEEHRIRSFLGTLTPATLLASDKNINYVSIVGEVAAGAFKDMNLYDFTEYEIPYVVDPRWPVGSVHGLIVRGESINKIAKDGDHVIVLHADNAPRDFQAGDWVVAERTRNDLHECTVKLVKGNASNGWELWPYSDDPAHQEPLNFGEHRGETVRVTGFVLDFVRKGTRF